MKYIIPSILILFVIIGISAVSEDDNRGLAKVRVIDSVEVYIQSEPVRDYKVVGDVFPAGTNFHMGSIDNLCEFYIKKGKDKGVEFDAIIFQNKWRAYLVKFK